jgi:hypothetical protein
LGIAVAAAVARPSSHPTVDAVLTHRAELRAEGLVTVEHGRLVYALWERDVPHKGFL